MICLVRSCQSLIIGMSAWRLGRQAELTVRPMRVSVRGLRDKGGDDLGGALVQAPGGELAQV
jgi:hypothetical protein